MNMAASLKVFHTVNSKPRYSACFLNIRLQISWNWGILYNIIDTYMGHSMLLHVIFCHLYLSSSSWINIGHYCQYLNIVRCGRVHQYKPTGGQGHSAVQYCSSASNLCLCPGDFTGTLSPPDDQTLVEAGAVMIQINANHDISDIFVEDKYSVIQ